MKRFTLLQNRTFKILCIGLFSFFLAVSCEKNEKKYPIIEERYPINISFSDYALEKSLCDWTNLNDDIGVIIINNNEKLNQYIACTSDSYPDIDFSKYTLLLAHGLESSSVKTNCYSLQQISKLGYEMKIKAFLGFAPVMTYWQVPIIVNKLSDGCIVELVVINKVNCKN